ncbi:APC family permease [Amycolatopsis acidiphila]|uniref:APC family permease n=1 Tax=Amycolatopsis acidiphila TaxID=715473 RepID=A0A558A219_9PSEU|nr:APC family permease [Amycolatopsis acidiphila]TVT18303.1 APC family permease [Amycolatopsis acidiphila]UIJ57931.1 APC family permease [Amycolatopsis acidiphila]GHG71047.1 amino acid permease [Amycolatopsis acidiphila]
MSTEDTRLTARLTLPGVVVFGLSYMAPAIVVSTFGVIAVATHGAAPSGYLLATIAMLLTALSYGKMARIFPVSGSVYTYARKMLDPRVGFLAGWAILLDYFFLPMVAWLIQSVYLNAQFPAVPVWAWLVVNIVLTTGINILGLVVADRVNRTLMALTIAGLVVLVAFCVHYLATSSHASAGQAFFSPASGFSAISAGAAIAAYSFLGFDAVSTLSEETRNPRRTIPRAIVLTVLAGGVLFVGISFVMQWVHPGARFDDPSSAGYAMSTLVGGKAFADVINIVTLIGGFASGLTIQASTSRLLYVMGRDGVLPRRFFGHLHRKLRTPVPNLLLIGAAALLALNLSVETATSFINFGAFLGFMLVNLCVIAYFVRQRRTGGRPSVFGHVLVPLAGAAVDVYLLTQLSSIARYLGLGWLALGVVYLAVLTRGFRKAPPEFELTDQPEAAEAAV